MLTVPGVATRRGFTLAELLVAMVIGGLVLALLTISGLRQQRLLTDVLDDLALSGQFRDASALLPTQLRAIGASAGDLREARDTALEARGTIAGAVVCDTAGGALVLAPATSGAETYTSYATSILPGDTAWLYEHADSGDTWIARAIASVGAAPPGRCAATGPQLAGDVALRARVAIALDSMPLVRVIGRPLRVTRPLRLSLYRSADGTWNLGQRDWNPASRRFNTIQPIAGPFLAASSMGLTFQYLDTNRGAMAVPLADTRAAAAVAITLRGETRLAVRALGAAARQGRRVDSASLTVLLRNRR